MGFFSNRCANTECNASVPKTAKFCKVCGEPASSADTNCGRCGAVVGAQSKYCWKCGCDLKQQQKAPLFGNRWVRSQDDFAVRVDECDVKGFLSKGLIIEHGTRGMIFQQGKFCGYIDEGKYDLNGFLRKINNFNQTTPTSVVLMDSGDIELNLEANKLYSKDQMEIDATFKALVQLKDSEKFYTNAFKSRNKFSIGYLAGSLADELRYALQTYVGSKSAEELYTNASIRQDTERQMELELQPLLERIGLDIVQLRFINFTCPDYEQARKEQVAVSIREQRNKLAQRLRESMTAERMSQIKTEKNLEDFIRQTEHDLQIKDLIRADEMEKLKHQFMFIRDKELLVQQIEIEGIKKDSERNQAKLNLIADIERRNLEQQSQLAQELSQAKNNFEIKRIQLESARLESEQDFWEAEKAIELRKKSELVEVEIEEKKVGIRSKASAQALISILDGPAADRVMKLEELRIKQNLTPDQLITMTAADNPQMAQIIAEKYKTEAVINADKFKQLQEFMAKQEKTYKDSDDRLERIMNIALQQMGSTSISRAQAQGPGSQTVVTSGGIGTPVVINTQKSSGDKNCSECKKAIPSDSNFCPYCQAKQ